MKNLYVLRKKYPVFSYEKYHWKVSRNNLEIFFDFHIKPDISFRAKIIIKNFDKERLAKIGDSVLNNFIFHLGLIEIPSYWKTTCSPVIRIRAGFLNSEQILWWKDLIIKSMGQYFYENKIDFRGHDFLKIICADDLGGVLGAGSMNFQNRYLVPMGGGRDSIVTLQNLKEKKKEINCFMVNPSSAAKNVTKAAGIKNPIIIERKIDPLVLDLNRKGFLNGHTPFTALLSFLSVFCAVLFDYKNIAFSNEKSAEEGNVKYLGAMINHQYTKSSEFEKKFKHYCNRYLAKKINYFSFLRKYTELEISKIFTKYPKYFPIFSSCNARLAEAARKRVVSTGRPASAKSYGEAKWCGKCPKCLFVYMTLYPFLENKILFKIFRKDLYADKYLLTLMKDLAGRGKAKPFECVGTFRESRLALRLALQKAKKSGKIPYLLKNI